MFTYRIAFSYLVLVFGLLGCTLAATEPLVDFSKLPTAVLSVTRSPDALAAAGAEHDWVLATGGRFYPLNGSQDTLLFADKDDRMKHFGAFDVSPDGQFIVTESKTKTAPDAAAHFVIFDAELNVVFEDVNRTQRKDHAPGRWSPDGTRIVTSNGPELQIFDVTQQVFTTVATDYRFFRRGGHVHTGPSWAPDSTHLVYNTNIDRVAILDLETFEVEIIDIGYAPVWSPDGSAIVFLRGRTDDRQVVRYDLASKELTDLFSLNSKDTSLLWTPDSQFIVYREFSLDSKYGNLLYFSFADQAVYNGQQRVAPLRYGNIVTLPDAFADRLVSLHAN